MRVHIFNPETDYALGCTGGNYNPPASVARLRKSMALFPATYAQPGDAILLLDDLSESELKDSAFYEPARNKGIQIIELKSLKNKDDSSCRNHDMDLEFLPWGWNLTLRNLLLRNGISSLLLKNEQEIEKIRDLAHRRTTIPFLTEMSGILPELDIKIPKEFTDVDEAMRFADENSGCYLKMPWSSSGRGVICTAGMSRQKLTEWLRGAITKQGCVTGEHGYDRVTDFATEWKCEDGNATFIGYSWFDTSSNGKYLGNRYLSQIDILQKIQASIRTDINSLINAQKTVIEHLIAPFYEGPLGIDMLADKDGDVNPCVEINLRMTMGMATILSGMENGKWKLKIEN